MRITSAQYKDFVEAMVPRDMLELAVEWIAVNLNPDDVFPDEDLGKWATKNGYKEK